VQCGIWLQKKKDMFCYIKQIRKCNILLRDQTTCLYHKRRIDMNVQMRVRRPDSCCSLSKVGSGIFLYILSLQVSDSLQIRLLATVENQWRCTMLTVQLLTVKVIYHVLHTCLCKHCRVHYVVYCRKMFDLSKLHFFSLVLPCLMSYDHQFFSRQKTGNSFEKSNTFKNGPNLIQSHIFAFYMHAKNYTNISNQLMQPRCQIFIRKML